MTKKVIYVLNHFLPYQTAGTEVYTWALSRSLQKYGWDVVVVVPNLGSNDWNKYHYDGIRVIAYPENSGETREIIQGKQLPDGLRHFESILNDERADIVHFHEFAHGSGVGIHHVQAAKKQGVKVLMTFHLANYTCKTGTLVYKGQSLCDGLIRGYQCAVCSMHERGLGATSYVLASGSLVLKKLNIAPELWSNRLGTALSGIQQVERLKKELNILYQNCDHLVSLTQWYRDVLIKNDAPVHKVHLIPQCLPIKQTTSIKAKSDNGVLKLMFLGRLSSFKGLHLLIDAVMRMDIQSVSLNIYGQETETEYVSSLKDKSRQHANIQWKGLLDKDQVISTMQEHDVLCLCSTFSEMSPLVIQEAFEAGIPVVASNVYGNAEQIQHGKNGLLFRFRDADALHQQLLRLIQEPELLLTLRAYIQRPCNFDEVAVAYNKLYESA
jgi:glycosyltransferase involved in cell wall biosynthesis